MLTVEQLEVTYGRVRAVRGISLNVDRGEIVAVVGPNGAGKSSILAGIFGLVPSRARRIEFDKRSLAGLKPDGIARLGLALVPEGRHIFTTLTVAENLRVGLAPRRDRRDVESDEREVLERFPALKGLGSTPAGKLSGGEQQQLAYARALISRPRMVLLDEPSLGLAPKIVDLVFATLAELRRTGVTVLLIEQNAVRAAELADRTYVLQNGSIALHGTREELRGRELAELYLGGTVV